MIQAFGQSLLNSGRLLCNPRLYKTGSKLVRGGLVVYIGRWETLTLMGDGGILFKIMRFGILLSAMFRLNVNLPTMGRLNVNLPTMLMLDHVMTLPRFQ